MSRTILAEVGGWTPVMDSVVNKVGPMTAMVFGTVWRRCQLKDGVCTASQETLAKTLQMSRQSINKHIAILIKHGYLRSEKSEYGTLKLIDTGKACIKVTITATEESDTPVNIFDTPVNNLDSTLSNSLTTPVDNFDTRDSVLRELNKRVNINGNAIETEPKKKTRNPPVAPKGAPAPSSPLTLGQKGVLGNWNAKSFKTKVQAETILNVERDYGTEIIFKFFKWAAQKGMSMGDAISVCEKSLASWDKPKKKPDDQPALSYADRMADQDEFYRKLVEPTPLREKGDVCL